MWVSVVIFVIFNSLNLYVMCCIFNSNPIRYCYYYLCTAIILLINWVELILINNYEKNLDKNCLNFELADIEYSYTIIILILIF